MREKRFGAMISVTFFLFILVTLMPSAAADRLLSFSRPETDTPKFNHLVVDHNSGRVYVGATNWLYQLSPNLELEVAERTGPYEDSPECAVSQDCPTTNTKLTNNTNKVLVIDYKKGRLISCGSLFQGLCHVHNLHNVSDNEQVPNEAVAANDDAASTVAFIAPGPPNPPTSDVLYVGVSFTTNGPYRMDVPAVSSRSLDPDKMLDFASISIASGTRIFVNSLNRERYPINYVYGFASRGYSYFITTQKKSIDTPYLFGSKMIRICHRDPEYYSYTEIPIECKSKDGLDHVDYNVIQAAYLGKAGSELAEDLGVTSQENVLYAVFAQNRNGSDVINKSSGHSALCVYSMRAIHRKFTQNIQHCFSGNGERGLDFITPSIKCIQTQLAIDSEFCGLDINTPLGGQLPIVAHPVITFEGKILTAVAAAPVHDYTAAFLGTSTGHFLKVVVETSKNAFQYDFFQMMSGDSPVNPDLVFDRDMQHLYVVTERMVRRLKVQECEIYGSCSECLGSKDPYCGWCTIENKCAIRSECQQASQDPLYWLTYRNDQCTIITSVKPFELQRTTARILTVTVDNLPEAPSGIECVFTTSSVTVRTNAVNNSGEIRCPTPRTDILPHVPEGQHYFTSKLSIQERNGSELAAIPFKFFDCATYTSCTQCVTSPFPCDWCVDGYRCTHDTSENCRNDILVTGNSSVGPSIREGPGYCPKITGSTMGTPTTIFVPNGSSQRITVRVANLVMFTTLLPFTCQFSAEGSVKRVSAQLLGDTVYCDVMQFNYTSNVPMINVKFDAIWAGDKAFDNPLNIHVVVYHCSDVAVDCLMCFTLPKKERCSWCEDSPRCQGPVIRSISPPKGPKSGGTRVNITGDHMNAFSIFEVFISNLPCKIHRATEHWLECTTSPSPSLQDGELIIKYDRFEKKSEGVKFSYVSDPEVTLVEPTRLVRKKIVRGIPSGGVPIIVRGIHFDIVQEAQLYVIDQTQKYFGPCQVETATIMHCQSPIIPVEEEQIEAYHEKPLELGFVLDNITKYRNFSFYLEPSPKYYAFEEKNHVKCYKSDYLTINGEHLDLVYSDEDVAVEVGTGYCNVTSLSRSQLTCRPPSEQPSAKGLDGSPDQDNIPTVVVVVGGKLRFKIGYMAYDIKGNGGC